MQEAAPVDSTTIGSDDPLAPETGTGPVWRPPKSRADRSSEEAVLACVRRGRPDEALTLLMNTYGAPILAFALRVIRNHELAKDVRQQVFLEAFQGINRFQGRSSLWSWRQRQNRVCDQLAGFAASPTIVASMSCGASAGRASSTTSSPWVSSPRGTPGWMRIGSHNDAPWSSVWESYLFP